MSLLNIVYRNLLNRKLQSIVTIIIVAVGVALSQSVMLISDGMKEGMKQTSGPYGMLVGSKGSSTQLVMNTIFLSDTPLGNLDYAYFEKLRSDARVSQLVPFGMGDNYKGFRIIGTNMDFFEIREKLSDPPYFRLKEGRSFKQPFEIVLGAETARQGNLKVGDTFIASHGAVATQGEEEHHNENPYIVVGVLAKTFSSADLGIYTPLESYWISHTQPESMDLNNKETKRGVTAILVKPDSYVNLYAMYQEINLGKDAQAVFPGKELAKLFDMIGSGKKVLEWISYAVLGMAGLSIMLSMYGSMLERKRTVAILRAIGASKSIILVLVFLETFVLILFGTLAGAVLGYGIATVFASYMINDHGIGIVPLFHFKLYPVVFGVCFIGMAGSLIPALSAYRTEVSKYLNPL
ncbi:FtsX-like permease family protein [Paenibacillus psychroresistens]|uniref:Putative hemin transport system permease protein HrtB n=1 Tax=Paenibacillus psychroresistens TaxID=1778678 RepID=A0A6B8RGZ7_9BACL|nr:ABC transporter permease [Paenibacillus psychroresistens]QGQ94656.1 FtsX-like permease family protein [Paenibacillus psychroresistens]